MTQPKMNDTCDDCGDPAFGMVGFRPRCLQCAAAYYATQAQQAGASKESVQAIRRGVIPRARVAHVSGEGPPLQVVQLHAADDVAEVKVAGKAVVDREKDVDRVVIAELAPLPDVDDEEEGAPPLHHVSPVVQRLHELQPGERFAYADEAKRQQNPTVWRRGHWANRGPGSSGRITITRGEGHTGPYTEAASAKVRRVVREGEEDDDSSPRSLYADLAGAERRVLERVPGGGVLERVPGGVTTGRSGPESDEEDEGHPTPSLARALRVAQKLEGLCSELAYTAQAVVEQEGGTLPATSQEVWELELAERAVRHVEGAVLELQRLNYLHQR